MAEVARLTPRAIVHSSRPLLWLNTAVPAALAVASLNRPLDAAGLLLVVYFTLPFNLFLHGVNDVYDYESDLLNERKGGVEGARLDRRLHAPLLRRLLLLNLPFVLLLLVTGTLLANLLLSLFLVAGWVYSAPPVRAKSRPFLDNLVNGAYVFPFLIGLAREGVSPDLWPWRAIGAFVVWSFASHAFTSIQDIEADRRAGISTIATALGPGDSSLYALALYTLAALLAAGYGLLWGLLAAIYPALVIWYLARPGRGRAKALYRAFIVTNSSLGFIVTVALAVANPRAAPWVAVVVPLLVVLVVVALRWTRRPPGKSENGSGPAAGTHPRGKEAISG